MMDVMPETKPQVDSEVSQLCREKLRQFETKQITQQEFDRELAYISINKKYGWDEIRLKPLPTPPTEILEYQKMNQRQKQNFLNKNPDIFKTKYIQDYLDQKSSVISLNKRNYEWLLWLKNVLVIDEMASRRVETRLMDFRAAEAQLYENSNFQDTNYTTYQKPDKEYQRKKSIYKAKREFWND